MLDVSVVVPVRNAEAMLDDCLRSIVEQEPREIIVVDGCSTDSTVEIARRHGARVLSDEGEGLPVARLKGTQEAGSEVVALVDADVVLPAGSLGALLDEFRRGRFVGLQAGLHSVSGSEYWGRALAHHHRTGRSRNWFGLVATIFDRVALLEHGFDERFMSGEDIELRWRLERTGAKVGVSSETLVLHRFGDSWAFAKGQFLADGHGLARMILMKPSLKSLFLLALPGGAGMRGVALSAIRGEPHWILYYVTFTVFNYAAMIQEFVEYVRARRSGDGGTEVVASVDGRP